MELLERGVELLEMKLKELIIDTKQTIEIAIVIVFNKLGILQGRWQISLTVVAEVPVIFMVKKIKMNMNEGPHLINTLEVLQVKTWQPILAALISVLLTT